jgi:hypothetical protein
VIPWTQRVGTLMMSLWQKMSDSPLSEGYTCFYLTDEHPNIPREDNIFCFTILLL